MDYNTVLEPAQAEYVEKRSRFIARVFPVENEEEAISLIRRVRSEHWDASHNAYAYVLLGGAISRFSDDGEPQGTAGMPILNVIRKTGICNCLVTVTRYFGGTLLGAGGLCRAYSKAAGLAVERAGLAAALECGVYLVRCGYQDYQTLKRVISLSSDFAEKSAEFSAEVVATVLVRAEKSSAFLDKVRDLTGGRALVEFAGSSHMLLPLKSGDAFRSPTLP